MSDLKLVTREGCSTSVSSEDLERFQSRLRGALFRQEDEGYESAREIWNAMIEKRPALIVRCAGVADVIASVAFAREHDLLVAIRGGGHNIAGNALCDGGLQINLSDMTSVRVDPQARRAYAEPGATLGDLDHETQAFGLATPVGINSTTGLAGLTLGGGFGWLTRKYGLTIDNLISADVVTAEGKLVRASAEENPDLFWAVRGGGGNFGIVTNFEFQLYPVGPEILCGLIVFPYDQAKEVLTKYREYVEKIPEDLNIWVVLRQAPPLPFLPEAVHGQEVVVLAAFYAADIQEGQTLIEPLKGFGQAHGEHIGPMPYTAWEQAFDPLLTPGARNYWKSHNFLQLGDGVLDTVIEYAGKLPSSQCEIFIGLLGGQASRVEPTDTAYAHRDAKFVMNVHGRWDQPADDEGGITWARQFFDAAAPHATGGAYVNFMTEEEVDRVSAAYGPNYERMVEVKAKYDPTNFFRLNHNVQPKT